MQVARRPLLEVLEPAWIASQLPTWLVGFTTVAALELTAAGLALAHADALARAEDRELQVVEAREDRALAERNAQLDENRRLLRRLAELEEEPRVPALVAHSGPEPAQGSNGARPPAPLVAVPCRHGCGWTSEPMPEPRARRAERAHVGHHHKDSLTRNLREASGHPRPIAPLADDPAAAGPEDPSLRFGRRAAAAAARVPARRIR